MRRKGSGLLRREGDIRGEEFIITPGVVGPSPAICILVSGDQATGDLLLSGDQNGGTCEGVSGDQR